MNINSLIETALCGFSCVAKHSSKQWFNAHYPAAVLAGAALIENPNAISDEAKSLLAAKLYKVIDHESDFFADSLFEDANASIPVDQACATIAEVLAKYSDRLSCSGHSTIIAALALKAIVHLNKPVPAQIVNALEIIIAWTSTDDDERYYGSNNYMHDNIDNQEFLETLSLQEAINYCATAQKMIYKDQSIDGKHYYFTGEKLHEITHTHAAMTLSQLGYKALAENALIHLKKQFLLNQQKPKNQQPYKSMHHLDPFETEFWSRDFVDPHHIKLAYASIELCAFYNTDQKKNFISDMAVYWELLP